MNMSGKVFVLGDHIDTDQIISAEYLHLVPTKPDELKQLGQHAFDGLGLQYERFEAKYTFVIAGKNFGCGSSREHAPVALAAAGIKAVIAQSYARIFYRNCIATGSIFPLESKLDLTQEFKTGDEIEIDLEKLIIKRTRDNQEFSLIELVPLMVKLSPLFTIPPPIPALLLCIELFPVIKKLVPFSFIIPPPTPVAPL